MTEGTGEFDNYRDQASLLLFRYGSIWEAFRNNACGQMGRLLNKKKRCLCHFQGSLAIKPPQENVFLCLCILTKTAAQNFTVSEELVDQIVAKDHKSDLFQLSWKSYHESQKENWGREEDK